MKAEIEAYLGQLAAAQAAAPPPESIADIRAWYRTQVEQLAAVVTLPPLARRAWHPVGGAAEGVRALVQAPQADPSPGILYFHGGGYALADPEATEPATAQLAVAAGCTVVSVDYRLAPEHPYPAAHEDALAAWRWVRDCGAALGVDPARIAVAGDSSGAALALHVALEAEREGTGVAALALLYGWYIPTLETESMRALGPQDPVLPLSLMEMFRSAYFGEAGVGEVLERALPELPDACVIVGERDPLYSDSERLVAGLRAGGTMTELHVFGGMPHGFSTVPLLTDGRRSIDLAASFLASRCATGGT